MQNFKFINESWEDFSSNLIPKTAHPDQVRDMKLSFFAGVASMLSIIQACGMPEVSADTAIKAVESARIELQDFVDSLPTKKSTLK